MLSLVILIGDVGLLLVEVNIAQILILKINGSVCTADGEWSLEKERIMCNYLTNTTDLFNLVQLSTMLSQRCRPWSLLDSCVVFDGMAYILSYIFQRISQL